MDSQFQKLSVIKFIVFIIFSLPYAFICMLSDRMIVTSNKWSICMLYLNVKNKSLKALAIFVIDQSKKS